jgi:hypothetical protein
MIEILLNFAHFFSSHSLWIVNSRKMILGPIGTDALEGGEKMDARYQFLKNSPIKDIVK